MDDYKDVTGVHYMYHETLDSRLQDLHKRVQAMREVGKLSPQNLRRIRTFFKVKGIYHSNAIEGNALTIGETRMVVEQGLTLAGKTLRDQAEAKNLSEALDFMEDLATATERPIALSDVRQVHALILKDIEDAHAGKYRQNEVAISGSDYKPPAAQLVPQRMNELGKYIGMVTTDPSPKSPVLAAAAVHAWLAEIHPFIDGNGRTARILMNLILIRCGYPICIITREDRLRYYEALEESQAGGDISPLTELMRENVEESLEEWQKAAEEQRQEQEWLASLTDKFQQPELTRARNEYEVWRKGMALFRSYFKQIADLMDAQLKVGSVEVRFREFGELSFEKYLSLRDGGSAKRTWDFGLIFQRGNRRVRYTFFYGSDDYQLRERARVVLLIARAEGYEYDDQLLMHGPQHKIPDLYKIGFDIRTQGFVARTVSGVEDGTAEQFARKFYSQVVQRDFGA